jgi:cellulose synthase/poly-beta-1,6-N-acetylglucosamine synthase-like glycosyltransferase
MTVLNVALGLVAVPMLLASSYLLLLTLFSRRPASPRYGEPELRFDMLVPAHDEEGGVGRTVETLLAVDYPGTLRRVIVVADNCSDRTASRAAQAGAVVWERNDPSKRGKGYALAFGFDESLREGFADAVVVVDADTEVSLNLLRAFAARLASGVQAVQARSCVLNPEASWRTRLITLQLTLFNGLRSVARENLGLSCGLRGNGMCLSRPVLLANPHRSFSLAEDLEYSIALGMAGVRVHYAEEAVVKSEMVSSERAARSQRRRWEEGRAALSKAHGRRLLAQALKKRDPVRLDLALDLMVPPLSVLAATVAAGCGASLAASLVVKRPLWGGMPWLLSAIFLVLYVLRGVQLSGVGLRGLATLAWAPVYMAWKVTLLRSSSESSSDWVRTAREAPAPRRHASEPGNPAKTPDQTRS